MGSIVDGVSVATQFLEELSHQLPNQDVTTSVGPDDPATAICKEVVRLDADTGSSFSRRRRGAASWFRFG